MNKDHFYMTQALSLAAKGNTSPNPKVGALIVKQGKVLGMGYHRKAGMPHAEIEALKKASNTRGATMYVTLEPCAHSGKTPPCTNAIIKAGIKEVVIACRDPNPITDGKGIKMLKKAGIKVRQGVMRQAAEQLNKPFFIVMKTGKPYVVLKAAMTLDGKIATASGESKWISGKESRAWVHKLRSQLDGILVGEATIIKDDPQLSARMKNGRNPVRIILYKGGNIPVKAKVFLQHGKTLLITTEKYAKKALLYKRAEVICCKGDDRVDLDDALHRLAQRGIHSLLVEGGSRVITQFVQSKLVDEFHLFIAPKLLGDNDAIPLFDRGQIGTIAESIPCSFHSIKKMGEDILISGEMR
ncbi:MAG: bifunctional diaminohydroxyphosphoribosylaminopyrimidine deaminase/5-amino-6-(5-phosphoribosylamino)uracil reductase RibD [Nanoarchaeota archaeon]